MPLYMHILNNLLRKVENLDKCMLSHSIKINFEIQLYFQFQLSSQSKFMKDFVCQAQIFTSLRSLKCWEPCYFAKSEGV